MCYTYVIIIIKYCFYDEKIEKTLFITAIS